MSPWSKPEEGLETVIQQMEAEDWERNMEGLAGTRRLLHHHPETLLVEYKTMTQLVLKQVRIRIEGSHEG